MFLPSIYSFLIYVKGRLSSDIAENGQIYTTDYVLDKTITFSLLKYHQSHLARPLCTLVEGFYDAVAFRGQERIISFIFPQLDLSAEQVLAGRK